MTAKEIFSACVGTNEEGNSKTTVRVATSLMDRATMEEEEKDEILLDKPIVDIFQSERLTMVNVTFDDPFDTDFIALSDIVVRFQIFNNSTDAEKSPIITLALMPKEVTGHYIMGVGGIAVIQPHNAGKQNDTVTFIFTNDTIHAYMLDSAAIEEETGDEKLIGE